ncbi:MAG TPA: gliding motility-associated C-terminal domain-containing protein [Saprospiraceae bacterium]|nr:gliding motility-associated C-terminal domain-containing protein [Saprospiraceae bacterium]HMQ85842.1 gliding motility-associated C-terminal domain-containing protein [Saprospiraceae bacterium]
MKFPILYFVKNGVGLFFHNALLVAVAMLAPLGLLAQGQCSGNLGINIFDSGDFGFGIPNVLPTNPNIAPGYNYTTSVPPNDGSYTLTKNTGLWPNNFPTWLDVMDNSGTSDGYMMVVNASYTPGDFYEQIVDDLCENTLYVFTADIINMIQSGVAGHIEPNVSFLINDQVRYTTGNIPQNATWITYGFSFATEPGETSVKLTLRNNAPGGIGNDLALDNISFQACGPEALILPEEIANICEDGAPIELDATVLGDQFETPSIQWQFSPDGENWTDIPGANGLTVAHTQLAAGYYYYRYLLANSSSSLANSKCQIISNVKIVFVQPKFYTINDTICEGLSYQVGNSFYDKSGTYTDSLTSSIGCDSIVTLNLEIASDYGISYEQSTIDPTCYGYLDGSFSIFNVNTFYPPYTIALAGSFEVENADATYAGLQAGDYTATITDAVGCSAEPLIELVDPNLFFIELGLDHSISLGEMVQISTFTNYTISSFNWSPEGAYICPDGNQCLNPTIFPFRSGSYKLTAFNEVGCIAVDSVFIEVSDERLVYIPSAFSPNEDGRNDRFQVFAGQNNVKLIQRLQVFNRWGALVYEVENIAPHEIGWGWDGTFQGEKMNPDAFAYVAEVLFIDDVVVQYKGEVMLME